VLRMPVDAGAKQGFGRCGSYPSAFTTTSATNVDDTTAGSIRDYTALCWEKARVGDLDAPIDMSVPSEDQFDTRDMIWRGFTVTLSVESPRRGADGDRREAHATGRMWIQTWEHFDDLAVAKGVLTEWEVSEMRHAYEDPTFTWRGQLMQSTWGGRPPQP
jgi:hypothetical protein